MTLLAEVAQSVPGSDEPPRAAPIADAGPEGLQASARRARHLVHLWELSAARALSASPLAPGNEATFVIRRAGRKKPTNPSLMTFLLSARPMLSPCGPPSYSPTLAGPGMVPRPALPDTLPSSCALSLTTRPPPTVLLGSLSRWPEEPCPLPLLPPLASVGSLLSPSLQGGSGALLSVISFAASSRGLAQQYAAPTEEACSPHEFALSTRSGADSVVHALSVATELEPTGTIVPLMG